MRLTFPPFPLIFIRYYYHNIRVLFRGIVELFFVQPDYFILILATTHASGIGAVFLSFSE